MWQNGRTSDSYTTVILYIKLKLNITKICLKTKKGRENMQKRSQKHGLKAKRKLQKKVILGRKNS